MHERWVVLVAVATLTAGCGAGTEGTAVAGAPAEAFDPCSIPDTAIAATGLDPSTKRRGWSDGVSVTDWSRCTWRGPVGENWYFLEVLTTSVFDLDDVRDNLGNFAISTATIGPRSGITYRFNRTAYDECAAAFAVAGGVATFVVTTIGGQSTTADPCETVVRHSSELESQLPAAN